MHSGIGRFLSQSGKVFTQILVFITGILLGGVVIGEVVRAQYRGGGNVNEVRNDNSLSGEDSLVRTKTSRRYMPASAALSRITPVVRATKKVVPAVVSIAVTQIQVVRDPVFDDFFGGFFIPEYRTRYREVNYIGSGIIFDSLGYILTNHHVVKDAARIMVNLADGREFKGELVGADNTSDLAVIHVRGRGLPWASLGNSSTSMLGETVIAIGNPFGYMVSDANPSVTSGIISALHRDFKSSRNDENVIYRNMIQTDATINPGNSGGPLVNVAGKVVGINAFIVSPIKGSVGLGFAIPVNKAKKVARELMKYGIRRRYHTGLRIQDLDQRIALALGLPRGSSGVAVTWVERSGPADRSGLKVGDVIVKVNKYLIRTSEDIQLAFAEFFAGDKVYLTIIRKNKKLKMSLVLEVEKNQVRSNRRN